MTETENRRVVVITGASSGMNQAVAERLADKGYNIVLAARREQELEKIAKTLEAKGVEVLVVPTDVTQEAQLERLAETTIAAFGRFDVWINGAGITFASRFLDHPSAEFQRMLDTNINGVVFGSRVALQHFNAQGRGTLLNISSGIGALPGPYVSAYSAGKSAVRAFTAAVREEFFLDGKDAIHICTILPMTVDTPIYQHAGNRMGVALRAVPPVYSVTHTAKVICKAIERPRAEVLIGRQLKVYMVLHELCTPVYEKLFARYIQQAAFKHTAAANSSGNTFESHRAAGTSGGWRKKQQVAKVTLAVTSLALLALVLSKKRKQ